MSYKLSLSNNSAPLSVSFSCSLINFNFLSGFKSFAFLKLPFRNSISKIKSCSVSSGNALAHVLSLKAFYENYLVGYYFVAEDKLPIL